IRTRSSPYNIPLFCSIPHFDPKNLENTETLIENLQNDPLSCLEELLSQDLTKYLSLNTKNLIQQKPSDSLTEIFLALAHQIPQTDREILLKGLINLYHSSKPATQEKIQKLLNDEREFCNAYAEPLLWEIQKLEGWKMTYTENSTFQIDKLLILIRKHLHILSPQCSPKTQRKIAAYKR
ncbi:MAG: hypothetical protein WCP39_03590, partial [Chlamydiota bacterium]